MLECNSELTGVGPAMASGNHVWSGNWPLLPMQAMNNATEPQSSTVREALVSLSAHSLMAAMLKPLLPDS